ncbi:site-specific DNA-methyltransferase [Dietzia cercidiphylli]|uniref:site-specific DNA-methyltransferase n=1 Tax=Dietzia cercidiphylli TaxID=498199 RepID=UPI003F7E56BD
MTSPDLTATNIDKIADLFPGVVTEGLDADGKPRRALDFDMLRQELSDHIVDGPQERYQLDWPGKRASTFAANASIAKTLRPVREESVDFESTENLFIEGDNLDALKLLQESYLGKIKLIYIDPPYNTGSDFVYNDRFASTTAEYLRKSGQNSGDGARLVANPEANGRFHSDWLSMMYPRLRLARNLLSDDGFLFVSIDDGEIANLRQMCGEIFGEANFVCTIMWRRKRETSNDSKNVAIQGEYILVFARSPESALALEPLSETYVASAYREPTLEFPDGRWRGVPITVSKGLKGGGYEYTITSPSGKSTSRTWAYPRVGFDRLVKAGRIYWGMDGSAVPQRVMYAHESQGQPATNYWDSTSSNKEGKKVIIDLFGEAVFDTAKPLALIQRILGLATGPNDTVLDFFAGSSTTAHAVLAQNVADGGRRRFIMVQLDEAPAPKSEAAKARYRTIADLSRERIRRAAKKAIETAGLAGDGLDAGFRTLRIDTTNLTDVLRTPDEIDQQALSGLLDSVKDGRTGEDLLFQVLLDWGLEVSMPIGVEQVEEREVFVVDGGALVACFDNEVTPELVRVLAKREPLRAVFLDAGFSSDDARINAEQVFKELSPATDVKAV